jgi:hypothetical protein
LARRGNPPRKVVRKTLPVAPHVHSQPRQVQPARPLTGRILAVLLGGLFVAAVLVIAVKAFGAAGHPLMGFLVGIACLAASALIYLHGSRKRS